MQMNKDVIQKLGAKNKELRLELAKKKAVRFYKLVLVKANYPVPGEATKVICGLNKIRVENIT